MIQRQQQQQQQQQQLVAAAEAVRTAAGATATSGILHEKYLKRFGIVLVQKSLVPLDDRPLIVSHCDPWLECPTQGHLTKVIGAELPQ